jgi:cell division topological specificity factor
MNLFKKLIDSMSPSRQSAKVARERLQIVLSHQRADDGGDIDFLPKLRHELLAVICKYVQVDPDQINVQLQKTENRSVLELNITLPG